MPRVYSGFGKAHKTFVHSRNVEV